MVFVSDPSDDTKCVYCEDDAITVTGCCHEAICENCYAKIMVPECRNSKCINSIEVVCETCAEVDNLNEKDCRACRRY